MENTTQFVSCAKFFDGEAMHGPTVLTLTKQGVITNISQPEEPFQHEFDLITPGLFDLQMNGFRAVDVATATAEELLMLDTELAELGVTSWLASIITRDLSEMTVIIGKLHAC